MVSDGVDELATPTEATWRVHCADGNLERVRELANVLELPIVGGSDDATILDCVRFPHRA